MTREEGVVIKTDAKTAWIKTVKTDACASCSAKSSCHTLGGGKEVEVEAINTAGARIGDRVVIGFETAPLLKATFLLYVFPILGLLLGAFIGQTAAPLFSLNPSAASIIVGFLFLFLAYVYPPSNLAFYWLHFKGGRTWVQQWLGWRLR